MYTASKIYGIGEITSETDSKITVYFADKDVEKTLSKSFVKIYNTSEDAGAALNEITDSEIAEVEETRKILESPDAGAYLSELNKANARKNLPSWMRD